MPNFETRVLAYMRALLSESRFGFSVEDAAAIVGNAAHESGLFRHVQEIRPVSGRGGLGDFQWTGPRRAAFERWIARKGFPDGAKSFEANYGFLFRELIGPEAHAVGALKGARGGKDADGTVRTTLYAKTRAFERAFERAGVPAWDARARLAERALDLFRTAHAPAPPLDRPAPRPAPAGPAGSPSKTEYTMDTVVTTLINALGSKTFRGLALTALSIFGPPLAAHFGYTITNEDLQGFAELAQKAGEILGLAYAAYGRIVATKHLPTGAEMEPAAAPAA